ncbi:hypothetical protein B0H19DRAFT_1239213 [Mycena capillaripes]|nr:hypothetical protein B0H19DRAFT_1239213 [Mycena capillaripes]
MIRFTVLFNPAARVWNLRLLLLWTVGNIGYGIYNTHNELLQFSYEAAGLGPALRIAGHCLLFLHHVLGLVRWPFKGSAVVDLGLVLLEIAQTFDQDVPALAYMLNQDRHYGFLTVGLTTFWGRLGQPLGRGPRPTSANPLARPSRSRLVDLGFNLMPILWHFLCYWLLENTQHLDGHCLDQSGGFVLVCYRGKACPPWSIFADGGVPILADPGLPGSRNPSQCLFGPGPSPGWWLLKPGGQGHAWAQAYSFCLPIPQRGC